MKDAVGSVLGRQFDSLKRTISGFNMKGDLQGLFSYHVLSDSPEFGLDWDVRCDDDNWLNSTYRKDNLYHLASLGYSMYMCENAAPVAESRFLESLALIKERKLFNGGHMSFPFQPMTFLGIVLGVKSIGQVAEKKRYTEWLSSTLEERRRRAGITGFHSVFYKYIEAQLDSRYVTINDLEGHDTLEELSFIEWGRRKGCFEIQEYPEWSKKARNRIVQLFVRTNPKELEPEHAPLVWASSNNAVSASVDAIVVLPSHLCGLLKAFPAAMKRWRYDDEKLKVPVRWPINGEREVQDIVWLMLRPYFKDLIDEETLPKFGHSSYKPDFAIPSLSTLIEVKYVRKKADFDKIEKEILEDSVAYLTKTQDYKKLVVFIYDHSCSTQEHEETRRDLVKIQNIEDVIIVSRPSQLPAGGRITSR